MKLDPGSIQRPADLRCPITCGTVEKLLKLRKLRFFGDYKHLTSHDHLFIADTNFTFPLRYHSKNQLRVLANSVQGYINTWRDHKRNQC
jgi:hypothetical protein